MNMHGLSLPVIWEFLTARLPLAYRLNRDIGYEIWRDRV